jgi:hypothetical protein
VTGGAFDFDSWWEYAQLSSRNIFSNSVTIDGASYGLDNAGNRTSKTDWLANVTSNYAYDQIYELTRVPRPCSLCKGGVFDWSLD